MIKNVLNRGLNNTGKLFANSINKFELANLAKFTNIQKLNLFTTRNLNGFFNNIHCQTFASFEKPDMDMDSTNFKSEEANFNNENFIEKTYGKSFDKIEKKNLISEQKLSSTSKNKIQKSNSNDNKMVKKFSYDRYIEVENVMNEDFNLEDKDSNSRLKSFSEVKKIDYSDDHVIITKEEEKNFYMQNSIIINSKLKNDIPKPLLKFSDLSFDKKIINSITGQFSDPTPIQSITWPIAQNGNNLVGVAETGSGKTLSFLLPAMNHIINQKGRSKVKEGPIVLIIAPTRELAVQIHTVANDYAKHLGFRTACLYGGAPRYNQIRELIYGVEMIIATPGRLIDLFQAGKTNFLRTSFVVLDEADRMLDMGFEKDLRKILTNIRPDCQTLMWSATWPREIVKLAEEFLKDYIQIKIGKSENGLSINKRIKQKFIFSSNYEKNSSFENIIISLENSNSEGEILEEEDMEKNTKYQKKFPKSIVFTNKKYKCEELVDALRRLGLKCESIHGDKSQSERDYAFKQFKNSQIEVLVATDVAARGLDVNDVKLVINYDFPNNIEDYVHRIGRTGRSGKTGISYAILTRDDYNLAKPLTSLLNKAEQIVNYKISFLLYFYYIFVYFSIFLYPFIIFYFFTFFLDP